MAKYDRKNKNNTRDGMFCNLGTRSSILTLPSDGALCPATLEKYNVISKDTSQVWIEKSSSICKSLKAITNERGYTNVNIENMLLEDYIPDRKFDLINADMECSLTAKLALAFEQNLGPAIAEGGSVIIWLTGWAREGTTSDFHRWVDEKIKHDCILTQVVDSVAEITGLQTKSVVIPIALMRFALNNFDFDYQISKEYVDNKITMVVFRLDNFRKKVPVLPSFSDIYAEFKAQHEREYPSRVMTEQEFEYIIKDEKLFQVATFWNEELAKSFVRQHPDLGFRLYQQKLITV